MSQVEAHAWWADVEHLREAAERRQAADAERRATERRPGRFDRETARARARAADRVVEAAGGSVDELSARRTVALEETRPRPRRPVPIWLADDVLADPVAVARARAAAPRRTVEIRGQVTLDSSDLALPAPRRPAGQRDAHEVGLPARRQRERAGLADSFAYRPDRVAFWAFALGLVLVLVAATSSQAAGF